MPRPKTIQSMAQPLNGPRMTNKTIDLLLDMETQQIVDQVPVQTLYAQDTAPSMYSVMNLITAEQDLLNNLNGGNSSRVEELFNIIQVMLQDLLRAPENVPVVIQSIAILATEIEKVQGQLTNDMFRTVDKQLQQIRQQLKFYIPQPVMMPSISGNEQFAAFEKIAEIDNENIEYLMSGIYKFNNIQLNRIIDAKFVGDVKDEDDDVQMKQEPEDEPVPPPPAAIAAPPPPEAVAAPADPEAEEAVAEPTAPDLEPLVREAVASIGRSRLVPPNGVFQLKNGVYVILTTTLKDSADANATSQQKNSSQTVVFNSVLTTLYQSDLRYELFPENTRLSDLPNIATRMVNLKQRVFSSEANLLEIYNEVLPLTNVILVAAGSNNSKILTGRGFVKTQNKPRTIRDEVDGLLGAGYFDENKSLMQYLGIY